MKAFFHFIKLNVLRALNYIRWPRWYFGGALIGLAFISIELIGIWFGWAWIMLGLTVWGFKKTN